MGPDDTNPSHDSTERRPWVDPQLVRRDDWSVVTGDPLGTDERPQQTAPA